MKTNRIRIRRAYAPLNVAVSMECLTPNNPAMQTYDASTGEYEPDREVEATVYCPKIQAHASDGTWKQTYANRLLATDTMKWYADGVDISTLSDWSGKYSIDTSDSNTRGAITIKRNIPVGTVVALHFEGYIADTRLGTNVPIVSDTFNLSTELKAEDALSLSMDDDQVIRYDHLKDRLFRYEYECAQNGTATTDSGLEAATDGNAYLRKIHFSVYRGADRITDGVTLTLYRVASTTTKTSIPVGTDEYTDLTTEDGQFVMTLDLRLVTKEDYLVVATVSGSTRPDLRAQFSVNRAYGNYDLKPTNGTDILPNDELRYDEVMAHYDGNILEHPESVVKMDWYTDTDGKKGMWHNEGRQTRFPIAETGIGDTYDDDWLELYLDDSHKPAHSIATDESGNVLQDEDGNILIFN